ncbi:MAG TPA: hypothetical protein VD813_12275 [Pseudonocardia sp.]|nr:hypothetical protein [Pseudonocardia sp.]
MSGGVAFAGTAHADDWGFSGSGWSADPFTPSGPGSWDYTAVLADPWGDTQVAFPDAGQTGDGDPAFGLVDENWTDPASVPPDVAEALGLTEPEAGADVKSGDKGKSQTFSGSDTYDLGCTGWGAGASEQQAVDDAKEACRQQAEVARENEASRFMKREGNAWWRSDVRYDLTCDEPDFRTPRVTPELKGILVEYGAEIGASVRCTENWSYTVPQQYLDLEK